MTDSKNLQPENADGKQTIDMKTVNFLVDPMVAHKIQQQMQENAKFAQTINTNITQMFYDYIIYKVKMRENLNLAIKGEMHSRTNGYAHLTRSGKSTVGLSLGNFVSKMTGVPYNDYHICGNESESAMIGKIMHPKYYSKVKNAKFNELYHKWKSAMTSTGNRRAKRVQSQLAGGQIRRRVVQRGDGDYGLEVWKYQASPEIQNIIANRKQSRLLTGETMPVERHIDIYSGQILIPFRQEAPVRTCSHRLVQCHGS